MSEGVCLWLSNTQAKQLLLDSPPAHIQEARNCRCALLCVSPCQKAWINFMGRVSMPSVLYLADDLGSAIMRLFMLA
jgi:hypothetical protein